MAHHDAYENVNIMTIYLNTFFKIYYIHCRVPRTFFSAYFL